ncbi:MAG: protein phosphatase 2C domain-containing protein [Verrucomicrobiales bacterium]|nr:protein phosphatase 2C domain-containing protein [Verrucomicrobiales bacterium]
MKIAKDGIRSIVKIGYDGRVHKTFRGTDSDLRFQNEVRVLKVLEARGCDFVPRLLGSDLATLTIITTNCGAPAEASISEGRAAELFEKLEKEYGVVHDDPFPRNITYNSRQGQFCIIDFELAQVNEDPKHRCDEEEAHRTLQWCGLTVDGSRRAGNQDALSVFSSDQGWANSVDLCGERSIDENGLIFAVSDGMGGPAAGDVASTLTVRELRRFLPAMMGDFHGAGDPEALLMAAVKSLDDYVSRVGNHDPMLTGMGATVVCGLFYRTRVCFAHVGDSRFYHFRAGQLTQLTSDHTYVGALFRAGKLNEREARNHPRRNVLQQAIGGGGQMLRPQVSSVMIEEGDWFLICSDGVTDGLWDKNIAQCFAEADKNGSDAEQVAKRILAWALDEAGGDDTTLFVVKAVKGKQNSVDAT